MFMHQYIFCLYYSRTYHFTMLMCSYYVYAQIFSLSSITVGHTTSQRSCVHIMFMHKYFLSSITVGHTTSRCSCADIMFMHQYICCLYHNRTCRFMMLMCSYYVYAPIYFLSSVTVGHVVLWCSCTHIMFMYQSIYFLSLPYLLVIKHMYLYLRRKKIYT